MTSTVEGIMKSWTLSDKVLSDPKAKAKAEELRPLLATVIGRSAPLVDVRWDLVGSSEGRSQLELNLSDWTSPEGVRASFGADESYGNFETRWKIHRLWGDLLQERNHRQLEQLELAEVE
jgi:hypothetical protein